MGKPSQFVAGFPDGIGKTGADGVSVGGMGVFVGSCVGEGVMVGVGVEVKVDKIVSVGTGVSVGFGTKVLHDVNVIIKTKRMMALLTAFMVSLAFYIVC
jgi:hypothetical protein